MSCYSHSGASIYYTKSDGKQWAEFLQQKLISPQYSISTELNDISADTCLVKSTKVNVFLITPDFLATDSWSWTAEFESETSIATLAGVSHTEFQVMAMRKQADKALEDWLVHELDGTERSVRDLLVAIIGIYEAEHHVIVPSPMSPVTTEENYDVIPGTTRKVNKLHEVFRQQPDKGSLVYMVLDRRAEGQLFVQFTNCSEPVKPTYQRYKALYTFPIPDCSSTQFEVQHEGDYLGHGTIPLVESHVTTRTPSRVEEPEEAKPDLPPKHTHSKIEDIQTCSPTQGPKLGQLKKLLSELLQPVQALCQCLGVTSETQLDDKMAAMVDFKEMDIPPFLSLKTEPSRTKSKWPTLLHFGAECNLIKFCEKLLSNRLMYSACVIENEDGLRPHQLAKQAGNLNLSELLEQFMGYVLEEQKEKENKEHDSGFLEHCPRLSNILEYARSSTASTDSVELASPSAPQITVTDADDEPPPPKPHTVANFTYQTTHEDEPTYVNSVTKPPSDLPAPGKCSGHDDRPTNLSLYAYPRKRSMTFSGADDALVVARRAVRQAYKGSQEEGDNCRRLSGVYAEVDEDLCVFGDVLPVSPPMRAPQRDDKAPAPPSVHAMLTRTEPKQPTSRDFESLSSTSARGSSNTSQSPVSVPLPSKKKQQHSWFPFFRHRSDSDIENNEKRREKNRSSTKSKSESEHSRFSSSSSDSMSEDIKEHERKSKERKEKSKDKINLFAKSAPHRRSMRIKHVIDTEHTEFPSVPMRKDKHRNSKKH